MLGRLFSIGPSMQFSDFHNYERMILEIIGCDSNGFEVSRSHVLEQGKTSRRIIINLIFSSKEKINNVLIKESIKGCKITTHV